MNELRVKATNELKKSRLKMGYSQRNMSQILNFAGVKVSESTYNKWESAERRIKISDAMNIAKMLNKSITSLFE